MTKNPDVTQATVDGRTEIASAQSRGFADHSYSTGESLKPVPDESKLISLSQQGDSEAFAHLYDRYVDRIYRYVLLRVTDDRVTEDITAHVFVKMWEKLPTYQAGQSPIGAWLYRIAHNAVIDHYRNRKTSIPLEDLNSAEAALDDRVEEKLDLQIKLQELREALKELTEGQRDVMILKFIEGLSIEEIARQLGKREGAVRALQMRGLRGLAKSPSLQMENQSYEE